MGLFRIAKTAAADPVKGLYLVLQRLAPGWLVDRLEAGDPGAGPSGPAFILSFDCDTDRDIDVACDVHDRLGAMGIMPVYAVPGELLERGAAVWRRIAETGAEFLNHGYRQHTRYSDGHYAATLFYERLSRAEVEDDVRRGRDAVARVTGAVPAGFRTPHFGSFGTDAELKYLHELLKDLGHEFSSSTVPYVALRYGPFTRRYGLVEIPVSGCPDFPMTILDSHTFRFTAGRFGPDDYVAQARKWADLLGRGRRLFVNLYADPSQVADWPEFFDAMRALAPYARPGYRAVLAEVA